MNVLPDVYEACAVFFPSATAQRLQALAKSSRREAHLKLRRALHNIDFRVDRILDVRPVDIREKIVRDDRLKRLGLWSVLSADPDLDGMELEWVEMLETVQGLSTATFATVHSCKFAYYHGEYFNDQLLLEAR